MVKITTSLPHPQNIPINLQTLMIWNYLHSPLSILSSSWLFEPKNSISSSLSHYPSWKPEILRLTLHIEVFLVRIVQTIGRYCDLYLSFPLPQRVFFTRHIQSTVANVPGSLNSCSTLPHPVNQTPKHRLPRAPQGIPPSPISMEVDTPSATQQSTLAGQQRLWGSQES
jgi:hypothetical protein